MLRNQSRAILTVCTVTFLLFPEHVAIGATPADEQPAQSQMESQKCAAITDWFAAYDQIRRDAEMTMGDKFQARSLSANKPSKRNAALAARMLKKYTIALSAIKELAPMPETKDLQEGYTEYFSHARELFSDFLDEQEKVPFSNQNLVAAKKKLEELDAKNKLLDKELRKKFAIEKHKHS